MTRGPGIGRLLLGVHAFILLVPVLLVVVLRLYDTLLLQQTERRLIGESVVIAEAWRDQWLRVQGVAPLQAPSNAPPGLLVGELFPVEPVAHLGDEPLRPPDPPTRFTADHTGPAWAAGQAVGPLLDRIRRVNLSGARVLDAAGCVVATTGRGLGACLDGLEEVDAALRGRYHAVTRRRHTDDPTPPLGSIRRRGEIRVNTALPIFSDGEVVGVVRMSRTSLDPVESLWEHRGTFLAVLLGCVLLTIAVTLYLTRTIARPVAAITRVAEEIADGDATARFAPEGVVPAEVHSLGTSLERMTRQLTDRAAYVSEYAAHVSHELKTPITAIRGAVELLQDQWGAMDDAQRDRFLGNVDADASRMQRLVTRLLALARIEHADMPVDTPPTDVARVASRYPGRVAVDLGDAPERLPIPADHLETAIGNLVDNAAQHGGEGPVSVSAARDPDGRLVVTVRDEGPGIDDRHRDQVFDRFFTTRRDAGGTGLGLTLVRAVAERYGGAVDLASGPAGTTATLRL